MVSSKLKLGATEFKGIIFEEVLAIFTFLFVFLDHQKYNFMKTLNEWFDAYVESHQNQTNQLIHFVCVPALFLSIVGFHMSIPVHFLSDLLNLNNPLIENWATVTVVFMLLFYLRLSFSMFLKMFIFSVVCIIGNHYLPAILPLAYTSLVIFIVAWIGQFYGHRLEGKKPSFFKDLQFLLIGSAWVIKKVTAKND